MPYSLSSRLTSSLIPFRNLNKEENWTQASQKKPGYCFYMKVAVAEIGLALSTIVAAIEIVVYGVFLNILPYLIPRSIGKRTEIISSTLLSGALNALKWNTNNLYRNIITYNLCPYEPINSRFYQQLERILLKGSIRGYVIDGLITNRFNDIDQARIGAYFLEGKCSIACELLHLILNKSNYASLKADLKSNEPSQVAIGLLSFLLIAECLDPNLTATDFQRFINILPTDIHEQLMIYCSDKKLKKQLHQFLKSYWFYLNPLNFDKLANNPQLSLTEKEIYLKISALSSLFFIQKPQEPLLSLDPYLQLMN